ncbi:MAG TPA: hypothetical protein VIL55_11085 [Naasia sp.]|jgi:energy-coupling factor transporter ATP-binding protein EcfA2
MTSTPQAEPMVPQWETLSAAELTSAVLEAAKFVHGRPRIIAIDGRSASGKSTLAETLHAEIPNSEIVHTDDIAWHAPYFGWEHLLRDGILLPLHVGADVHFQPPAWREHGRRGFITVPAGAEVVIVEGVGASSQGVAHLLDLRIWVQSDFVEAKRRGVERDVAAGINGDAEESLAFWHEWMGEELRFLESDRPWERASLIVSGTPDVPLAAGEYAYAPGPL